ncbi:MAG: hypothetical protein GTO45_25275, partial [Candidatus Aminicenantes bacterium]|nr:hypothetical protein [Candidatus Aminicenantes bacterium]NIM82056.1 hypothetical protein [Candidatus Aminicenantes bacterium]NIN21454.1 hypothetical protein [Candidatus Aminicenantes bacterium]NIN45266.1 hypothetical protein [Candidatus Aminicenantes bacterium]NIN88083.1 hypothetical protein [Candidatus Aminicenantes bacterium]
WVVESDYLHPEGQENTYGGIVYPFDLSQSTGMKGELNQPFRYLGRKRIYNNKWSEDGSAARLDKLTAVGYGEPTFAAFYPNCHSVFGCYDPVLNQNLDVNQGFLFTGLQYQVIGWYADKDQDPFHQFMQRLTLTNADDIANAVKEEFMWQTTVDPNNPPDGMVCYACLNFQPNTNLENQEKNQEVKVALGNTGTEALSAFLANELDESNKKTLEEQLEALQLLKKVGNRKLDIGPKFNEAFHEKGFTAVPGGTLWTIRPETAKGTQQGDQNQVTLPSELAHDLNTLNVAQGKYDRALAEIQSLRHLLFLDWYKYMMCAYPPDDSRDNYPDVDRVKSYIESIYIKSNGKTSLRDNAAQAGQLQLTRDPATGAISGAGSSSPGTLAAAAADAVNGLLQKIDSFNKSTINKTVFIKKLDKKTNSLTDITLSDTTQWVENQPFSTQCVQFNGIDAYIQIPGQTAVKGISIWVNIAAAQPQTAACLFAVAGLDNSTIGSLGPGDTWEEIYIDGKKQDTFNWQTVPKGRWIHVYVAAKETFDGNIYLMSKDGNKEFLSGKIASVRLFNDALSEYEIFIDMNVLGHKQYQLMQTSAPRFWQPNEPVVLLEGDAVKPSERHGFDGLLECQIMSIDHDSITKDDLQRILNNIDKMKLTGNKEKIGFSTWKNQPWHPFMLEWLVEVLPVVNRSNLDPRYWSYHPCFIRTNFSFDENQPDLSAKWTCVIKAPAIYRGSTILTPHAKIKLIDAIENYLKKLKTSDCYQFVEDETKSKEEKRAKKLAYDKEFAKWFQEKPALQQSNAGDFKEWYRDKPVKDEDTKFSSLTDEEQTTDAVYTAIRAYEILKDKNILSQSLGGFNAGLLMQKQTMQLPIADPLGFPEYQDFTKTVKELVQKESKTAPLFSNYFMPIRSGLMNILGLRIIDTFGQSKLVLHLNLDLKTFIKPTKLLPPVNYALKTLRSFVLLPPRIVQPARLNFRWLSADYGDREMNAHPASSPICGWLLPNNLDNSIMVYDQAGNLLGLIDQEANWEPAPGSDVKMAIENISNPYLRKVIQRLAVSALDDDADKKDKKQKFLNSFISVLDNALENIDPESFSHHQETALLMGRPIAVVRVSLNLELQGKPAVNHGWNHFRQDMVRGDHDTDGFDQVKFPIRIGERGQLNDGVVGYWKEDEDSGLGSYFYTTVPKGIVTNENIKFYEDAPRYLCQSISDESQTLTLLIDPRGKVHATCGVLPVKVIDIPPDQYTYALQAIDITFLSTPILTPRDKIAIPLPDEPGYAWSWLYRDRFHWQEVSTIGIVKKDFFTRTFEGGAGIWEELKETGWIEEIDANRARVVPKDQRTEQQLSGGFAGKEDAIQRILDRGHIVPVDVKAAFADGSEVREGWLKLAHVPGEEK